jgi:hypothetical protein
MKPCAVPGCCSPTIDGKLMCLPHWRGVPIYLQNAVYRTWSVFMRATKPNRKVAALRAYRNARDAAVAYVKSPTTSGELST